MYYLQSYKRQMCTCSLGTITRQQNAEVDSLHSVLIRQWLPTWEKKVDIMKTLLEILFFTLSCFRFLTTLVKLMSAPSLKLFSV